MQSGPIGRPDAMIDDDDDDDLQLYNYTPYFGIGPIQVQEMQTIHLNLML